jgi:hypothetical protein
LDRRPATAMMNGMAAGPAMTIRSTGPSKLPIASVPATPAVKIAGLNATPSIKLATSAFLSLAAFGKSHRTHEHVLVAFAVINRAIWPCPPSSSWVVR